MKIYHDGELQDASQSMGGGRQSTSTGIYYWVAYLPVCTALSISGRITRRDAARKVTKAPNPMQLPAKRGALGRSCFFNYHPRYETRELIEKWPKGGLLAALMPSLCSAMKLPAVAEPCTP